MGQFLTKKIIIISASTLIIALIIGSVFINGSQQTTVGVKVSSVLQEVVATGKTVSSDNVDILSEQAGKVVKVIADVGVSVKQDQILALLDSSELQAKISQARADVLSAQAGLAQNEASRDSAIIALNDLKNGTRKEDLDIKIANLNKAQADLDNALANVSDLIDDIAIKADGVLRNNLDTIFLNNNDQSSIRLGFSVPNTQIKTDAEDMRILSQQALIKIQQYAIESSKLNSADAQNAESLISYLEQSRSQLYIFRDFLNKVMDAVVASSGLSSSQITEYKNKVDTARTTISMNISAVNSKLDSLRSLSASVAVSSSDLKKSQAGASTEEIATQELRVKESEALILSQKARIQSQQAVLQSLLAQLRKYSLSAPFEGTITKRSIVAGQNIQPSTVAFSMISSGLLLVEANVSEVDIGRLKVGDKVEIIIDAFPGEKFSGSIKIIEPAETIIDGVVNYKIKVGFDNNSDARLKSGLTSSLKIETLRRDNVVVVPEFVIYKKDDKNYVKKIINGEVVEALVERGARGIDGNIEIISGLASGDIVVDIRE